MKRFRALSTRNIARIAVLIMPLLFGVGALAYAAPAQENGAAAAHGEEEHESAGDVIMHHLLDSNVMAFEPFGEFELPKIVVGGYDLSITRHVVFMWIAAVILLLVFGYVGSKYKSISSRQAPGGLANAMEALVEFIRLDVAKSNIGEGYEKHMPYLLTVFVFILVLNLLGLVPYGATATGNINVTLTLSVFTFLITQVSAIKAHGVKGYLAHLTAGTHWALWIIMIPIEVIGLFTKPFALTIRLFANMTAGHIVILSLIFISFIMKSYLVAIFLSVPFSIFIYLLEIFIAFLQAFIFTMLSALFIGLASSHESHEAEAAH
ncbi:MAG: F0F1 ATP synthase subunit A [Chlorobiales bacterium]|nr:F0F1 ATP synthase subunit A [Chlorobiales bacterium]